MDRSTISNYQHEVIEFPHPRVASRKRRLLTPPEVDGSIRLESQTSIDWKDEPLSISVPLLTKAPHPASTATLRQSLVEALINERMARQIFASKVARLERQLNSERRQRLALEHKIAELEATNAAEAARDAYILGEPKRSRPIELRVVERRKGTPLVMPEDFDE